VTVRPDAKIGISKIPEKAWDAKLEKHIKKLTF
jgi:hypothetical protein